MLSDRRQRVLAALIEEYVLHALPVGSRTLVENYRLGVSPATVRSELSLLEEDGYITQPHTSAGRVPTDYGYRTFVDDLLASDQVSEAASADEESVRALRACATELDDLLEQTTAAVARLTECLSIVLPLHMSAAFVKHVSLVSLSPHRILLVVVTEDEQVLNRTIETPEATSPEELAAMQDRVNALVAGKSVMHVQRELEQRAEALSLTSLERTLVEEVLGCANLGEAGRAYAVGLPTLMRQPEFKSSSSLIPVLQMLEDDAVLMQFFGGLGASPEPIVRIGSENDQETLQGVSVVATHYGCGNTEGIVAVIGPTRMDYAQALRAVRFARQALGDQ